jgi:hypothetical protein
MLVLIAFSHSLHWNVQVESFFLLIYLSFYLFPILFLRLFEAKFRRLFLISFIGTFLLLNGLHMIIGDGFLTQSEVFPESDALILHLALSICLLS